MVNILTGLLLDLCDFLREVSEQLLQHLLFVCVWLGTNCAVLHYGHHVLGCCCVDVALNLCTATSFWI